MLWSGRECSSIFHLSQTDLQWWHHPVCRIDIPHNLGISTLTRRTSCSCSTRSIIRIGRSSQPAADPVAQRTDPGDAGNVRRTRKGAGLLLCQAP